MQKKEGTPKFREQNYVKKQKKENPGYELRKHIMI